MAKFVRKLQKMSGYSYCITIPKRLVSKFGWKERQKLEIVFGGKKPRLIIRDWKPKKNEK